MSEMFLRKKNCVASTLGDFTNLGAEKETGELISHPSLSQTLNFSAEWWFPILVHV